MKKRTFIHSMCLRTTRFLKFDSLETNALNDCQIHFVVMPQIFEANSQVISVWMELSAQNQAFSLKKALIVSGLPRSSAIQIQLEIVSN